MSFNFPDANQTSIRPELMGNHPEDTTVVAGELAALQCVVVSDGPLHIEVSSFTDATASICIPFLN
jgi:hypothetical protein